jgi:hypothetical protein
MWALRHNGSTGQPRIRLAAYRYLEILGLQHSLRLVEFAPGHRGDYDLVCLRELGLLGGAATDRDGRGKDDSHKDPRRAH